MQPDAQSVSNLFSFVIIIEKAFSIHYMAVHCGEGARGVRKYKKYKNIKTRDCQSWAGFPPSRAAALRVLLKVTGTPAPALIATGNQKPPKGETLRENQIGIAKHKNK
jgi:hypothetical protein